MTLEDRLAASLAALGIPRDATIGVACSGGADSIALLHLLASAGRPIVALHVDHGLRHDSADDARFVAECAATLGVDCLTERVDVDARRGDSVEAVAREARYEALRRLAVAAGVAHVATAHTLEDQAETVLLRAMRGSTLDAIAPVSGPFVRPLLGVRRADLREWLVASDIDWREDPTNSDLRYERNWMRHDVLPLLRARRPGVEVALARLADRHRADGAALDALAEEMFERARLDDVGVLVDAQDVDLAPAALASRVVRIAFRRTGTDPGLGDIERVRTMRSSHLTVHDTDVWRIGGSVAFTRRPSPVPATVELPPMGTVDDVERRMLIRVGPSSATPWAWRAGLPAGASLRIRTRARGDRITTRVGSRKVSDILIDEKVPRPLRGLVGVLAAHPTSGGDEALAIVGRRAATGPSGILAGTVIDVAPYGDDLGWARELLWNR